MVVYSLPVMYHTGSTTAHEPDAPVLCDRTGDAVAVGEINQEIIALQLKSNELSRNLDETKSTITNIETQLGQTETQISELIQTVSGLSATITQSGGSNLLRNSSAQFRKRILGGPRPVRNLH